MQRRLPALPRVRAGHAVPSASADDLYRQRSGSGLSRSRSLGNGRACPGVQVPPTSPSWLGTWGPAFYALPSMRREGRTAARTLSLASWASLQASRVFSCSPLEGGEGESLKQWILRCFSFVLFSLLLKAVWIKGNPKF